MLIRIGSITRRYTPYALVHLEFKKALPLRLASLHRVRRVLRSDILEVGGFTSRCMLRTSRSLNNEGPQALRISPTTRSAL